MKHQFLVEIEMPADMLPLEARVLVSALTTQTMLSKRVERVEVTKCSPRSNSDTDKAHVSAACYECAVKLEELRRDNLELLRVVTEPPVLATALEKARQELIKLRHPLGYSLPDPASVQEMARGWMNRAAAGGRGNA